MSSCTSPAIGSLGNNGWDWDTFLKYVKKAERFVAFPSVIPVGLIGYIRFYPPDPSLANDFVNHYNPDSLGHDGT